MKNCLEEGERMTGEQIYQTALRQSAIDCSCRPEDFLAGENRVVLSCPHWSPTGAG